MADITESYPIWRDFYGALPQDLLLKDINHASIMPSLLTNNANGARNGTKLTTLSKKSQLLLLSEKAKEASKAAAAKKEREVEEETKRKQAEADKRKSRRKRRRRGRRIRKRRAIKPAQKAEEITPTRSCRKSTILELISTWL